ncbi:hypothetical protein [Arsenicibacter rosenii]|uniref:Tetrapyrrole biosynthesis glutamyl-tRNA reductase dimerisation domain-containing protein n=1 Tax=Arsenicibacter rosenii TaxID=1750698 RepID=A0A1S2VDC3_9BACT|nr:hypothetical protein [Arsenicibacter rosenii]OIN56692.1 hypothetical protein BLX24_23175 [Arsenicibacter rosenii]
MIAYTTHVVAQPATIDLPVAFRLPEASASDTQLPGSLVLKRFREALLDIQQSELSRYRKKLSDTEYALIEAVAGQMMQRIAVHPASQLLAASKQDDTGLTAELFAGLFCLTPANP